MTSVPFVERHTLVTKMLTEPTPAEQRVTVFTCMAWAKSQVTGSVGAKAILMALAERCNERPVCWPSLDLLAAETEQSKSTVQRKLDDLESAGFITRTRHAMPGVTRRGAPNEYRLHVDQVVRLTTRDERPDQVVNPTDQVVKSGDQVVTTVTTEVPVLEEPLEEPVENPPTPHGLVLISPPHPVPSGEGAITDFDRFWAEYPNRVDKAMARKAWVKALSRGAEPEVLIAGAARYASWGGLPDTPKYPATWLNNDCWENAYAPTPRRNGTVVDRNRAGFVEALNNPKPSYRERMTALSEVSAQQAIGGGA